MKAEATETVWFICQELWCHDGYVKSFGLPLRTVEKCGYGYVPKDLKNINKNMHLYGLKDQNYTKHLLWSLT